MNPELTPSNIKHILIIGDINNTHKMQCMMQINEK